MRAGKTGKQQKPANKTHDGYFMCLLTDERSIFSAWKIAPDQWKPLLRNALVDSENEPYLFLEIFSTGAGTAEPLEEHPVFGRENRWHLFPSEKTAGRRIIVRLTYQTTRGRRELIHESKEIDIPAADAPLSSLSENEKQMELYRLSEAGSRWHSGSCPSISS